YKQNFAFLLEALRKGQLPLWNPYIGLGRPFLADLQNAVFYPPVYLVLLGPKLGVILLLSLHAYWMAFGMRNFGAVLGMHPVVGYAAGFCFFLSGACAGHLHAGQVLFVCGISYIPWLFYCVARLDAANVRALARYAGLIALQ